MSGNDLTLNDEVIPDPNQPAGSEPYIDLTTYGQTCDPNQDPSLMDTFMCNLAIGIEANTEAIG